MTSARRPSRARILVIKLGALGDFVQAEPAFRAIRDAYPEGEITCLTTPPYAALAARTGYFDRIWDDGRPKSDDRWRALIKRLRKERFDRCYDLQCNDRTSAMFVALWPFPPRWSGVAPMCSHPHKRRDSKAHGIDRMLDQLDVAGIAAPKDGATPTFHWADRLEPPAGLGRYGVLFPACSPKRPEKRWPVQRFIDLAKTLSDEGVRVVIAGGPDARTTAGAIRAAAPEAVDMAGRTDLIELSALAAHARFFVGPDTGPCHLAAAAGAPGVVVFGPASDPVRHAPRGPSSVLSLIGDPIEKVNAADVLQGLRALGGVGAVRKAS